MKTIKVETRFDIPKEDGDLFWLKNGEYHREDGPAYISISGCEEWYLNGQIFWNSNWDALDLTNCIILSKNLHPEYPTIQIWKYINGNGIQNQIIIPGMEAWILE